MKGTLAFRLAAIALLQLVLLVAVFELGGMIASEIRGPRRSADVSVYDESGRLVASTADPPLRAPGERVRTEPTLVNGRPGTLVELMPGPPHRPPYLTAVNTIFVGGLVILVIGSLLTARGIVRPLRQLARAARVFGEGDLRTRTGLERSDEVGDVARAFDDMAARIERLLLAEKELLANVSHELRTPLARIRVALDIAEVDPEAGRASIAGIGVDLAELETLIDDILTATRLDLQQGTSRAAHFELHVEETSSGAVCQGAADRFRTRHPQRPLEVCVNEALPAIEVDPVLFRRVLDNLLENAHKYSPDPGSLISLRASALPDGRVDFSVEDHGMGIAADDLPRIFAPFFRTDRSRTRGTGGVGLGLALAKRIVEAHGGDLRVESTLDCGSTFRTTIRSVRSDALEAAEG